MNPRREPGSFILDSWVFTRNHVRQAGENNDVAALVDGYELIGFKATSTCQNLSTQRSRGRCDR